MTGLTHRQHAAMRAIERYVAKNGTSPSFEELQGELGLASKSSIGAILRGLEDRGYIRRLRRRSRSIEVLKTVAGRCPTCGR